MPLSLKAPGSPSSQLTRMYFASPGVRTRKPHLTAVGKAAPPLPRRPALRTSSSTCWGVIPASALRQRGVAAVGDVVRHLAGVDRAAVARGDADLVAPRVELFERRHARRRVAAEAAQGQVRSHVVTDDAVLDQLRDHLRRHVAIEDARAAGLLYVHQGLCIAQADGADGVDCGVEAAALDLTPERVEDLACAGGQPVEVRADPDARSALQRVPRRSGLPLQRSEALSHRPSPGPRRSQNRGVAPGPALAPARRGPRAGGPPSSPAPERRPRGRCCT